jgi:uncharacterized protein (DUF3820 family)
MNESQSLVTPDALVPFGKYRGRSVSEMRSDTNYMQWLTMQPWFRERFGAMYVFVTQGVQQRDSPTPEHNALQARFVDAGYRLAVLNALGVTLAAPPLFECEFMNWDVVFPRVASDGTLDGWHNGPGGDGYGGRRSICAFELKPTVGDEFPAIARKVKARATGMQEGGYLNGRLATQPAQCGLRVVAFDQWVSVTPLDTVQQMFRDIVWLQLPTWPLPQS